MVELTHRLDTILPLDKGPTFRTLHGCHCFEALIAIQDILQSEFVGGTYTSLIRKDTFWRLFLQFWQTRHSGWKSFAPTVATDSRISIKQWEQRLGIINQLLRKNEFGCHKRKKNCNSRESNPGLIRGRDLSYHLTTIAVIRVPTLSPSK